MRIKGTQNMNDKTTTLPLASARIFPPQDPPLYFFYNFKEKNEQQNPTE